MTLKHQSLGFLKNIGAKYYLLDNMIYFSCLHCGGKAELDEFTSLWKCQCGIKGNLGDLIRFTQKKTSNYTEGNFRSFINPKKEKYEINYLLNSLMKTTNNDTDKRKLIQQIQDKFNILCAEFKI